MGPLPTDARAGHLVRFGESVVSPTRADTEAAYSSAGRLLVEARAVALRVPARVRPAAA